MSQYLRSFDLSVFDKLHGTNQELEQSKRTKLQNEVLQNIAFQSEKVAPLVAGSDSEEGQEDSRECLAESLKMGQQSFFQQLAGPEEEFGDGC